MAEIVTYARPTWLYRYRSLRQPGTDDHVRADPIRLERELSAIEQGHVYCPTFNQMNDPMEGFYRSNQRVHDDPAYEAFGEMVLNEKLAIGIASFSETWDNDLMWAHYADGFRGFCIAYKVAPLLIGLSTAHALSRIAYGDKPHYLNLEAMHAADRARAILSAKNLKWAYEREWRLFAPTPGPTAYGSNVIATVYLGMRMDAQDRKYIQARLQAAGIAVRRILIKNYAIACSAALPRKFGITPSSQLGSRGRKGRIK